LLNNDVEVIAPNWLDEMVSHASRSEIGCVGAMLYYPDDTIQHAGVILGLGDVAGHAHKYMRRGSSGYFNRACAVQNYGAVTAACLAVRKSVFLEVGGLDEDNLTVAYNDVDLCLKVQEAGYRNLWTPYAELYHHESKSRGKDNTPEKKKRYLDEGTFMHDPWSEKLKNDSYYHSAFTKTAEQFQLRRMG
jgi:GT2 family glycosyltransferase